MERQQLDINRVLACLVPKDGPKEQEVSRAISYIEQVLIESYTAMRYAQRKYTTYEERKSLLIATLYKLILKQRALPTVNEFTEAYLNENRHLPDTQIEKYFANVGYLSLVTDLHFYFVLKQSQLFDEVVIDYDFDLRAQTDILLHKGDQTLGLQMFTGSQQSQQGKAIQLNQIQGTLSYPLYLYSRRMHKELHKQLQTKSGSKITLYSEQDAQHIARKLVNQQEETIEAFNDATFDEPSERFVFPTPAVKKQVSKLGKSPFEQQLQQAKHSILVLGNVYTKEKQTKMEALAIERGIYVYFYDVPHAQLPVELQKVPFIIDGQWNGSFLSSTVYKALGKYFKNAACNILQYEVEHFDTKTDIIVTAGAGSGKTHTLVSRTLFLLNTNAVDSIKDIAMITFTNEAADNMRLKLAERFIELFRKTGDLKYRKYLEELQEMQISTIPSFAKSILQRFGQFIGLGSEVNISNLTMDRRALIDSNVDEQLRGSANIGLFGNLPYYELVKFIEKIWEKVEQKGVSMDDFKESDKDGALFTLLLKTLQAAERQFTDIKIEKNTVTLSDLTRLLKELVVQEVPLERLKQQYRYLFIDEFQDTDNSQINFITEIAMKADIPLLVVGDSKQSVYRFRGANESAFSYLRDSLEGHGRTIHDVSLRYNYRTTANLLDQMEKLFTLWRKGGWLPKHEEPMIAKKQDAQFIDTGAFKFNTTTLTKEELINKYKNVRVVMTKKGKPVSMAILVRKNHEAQEIAKLLQSITKQECDMVYDVQLEGTLFQSEAAKDLLILLDSWIGEEDPVALYALGETVFCKDYAKQRVVTYESELYNVTEEIKVNIPQAWYDALEQIKYNPAILVLNEFLAQVPYMDNMAPHLKDFECTKYQLNLYKILMLMYAGLNEQTDLLSMYQWLSIQVATNQSEDEAQLDEADFNIPIIKVMTVHKSKGLEFHTVMIPFTESFFIKQEPEIIDGKLDFNSGPFGGRQRKTMYMNVIVHVNQQKKALAWYYANKKHTFVSITPNYFDLKADEDQKSVQEEARILYVAMTRAEERCFMYQKNRPMQTKNPKKWADLLNMRGEQ